VHQLNLPDDSSRVSPSTVPGALVSKKSGTTHALRHNHHEQCALGHMLAASWLRWQHGSAAAQNWLIYCLLLAQLCQILTKPHRSLLHPSGKTHPLVRPVGRLSWLVCWYSCSNCGTAELRHMIYDTCHLLFFVLLLFWTVGKISIFPVWTTRKNTVIHFLLKTESANITRNPYNMQSHTTAVAQWPQQPCNHDGFHNWETLTSDLLISGSMHVMSSALEYMCIKFGVDSSSNFSLECRHIHTQTHTHTQSQTPLITLSHTSALLAWDNCGIWY